MKDKEAKERLLRIKMKEIETRDVLKKLIDAWGIDATKPPQTKEKP